MKKSIFFFVIFSILHSSFLIISCFAQWQPDVRLTNNSYESYTRRNNAWCVGGSGNVVHVVWADYRDGNSEIYYKRSTNSGTNWQSDVRLTNNASGSLEPSIAVSSSTVHVVWSDYRDGNWEIYYKRSTNSGTNWQSDIRLTNNTGGSLGPSMAVSGSVVHVVWYDDRDGNEEIYYKRSTNGGVNWQSDVRLTNNTSNSGFPSVAVSGSVVHVVWYDNRDGNWEIYYKRSTNGGVNWSTDTRLTNNTASSMGPSVAAAGSAVHVVWQDNRDGNYEIYYKRSTDNGVNWSADTRLTNNTSNSYAPSIVATTIANHIVWEDTRNGNYEIYYKRSTNAGVNWFGDIRLTNDTADSKWASVAISGTAVYVVWEDNRNLNWEIYFKCNLSGNPSKVNNISTEIPSKYSLLQNYPNPFNPITKIIFQIPFCNTCYGKNPLVNLKVIDILGKEVTVLVNEELSAGTYEITFDGSQLTSGIYFYSMTAGDFTETKKMLLIK